MTAATLGTWAFASLNKVETAQYFFWWLPLLSIFFVVAPKNFRSAIRCIAPYAALWMLTEALWLLNGWLIEFRAYPSFVGAWIASIAFFTVQYVIIGKIAAVVLARPDLMTR